MLEEVVLLPSKAAIGGAALSLSLFWALEWRMGCFERQFAWAFGFFVILVAPGL